MRELWYQSIIFKKFTCANCTLLELQALPDRARRIRFYVLSLAPRLLPLVKVLLAGIAGRRTESPNTVLAQLARITGEKGLAQDIFDKYLGNPHGTRASEAFVEIIKTVRPEFNNPKVDRPDSILRYLRSRQIDEIDAVGEVIKNEKARAKPRGKMTRLDNLLGNNADDIDAVAKIVKKAMGRITSEKAVLKYLRSSDVEEIPFVKTMLESRPETPRDQRSREIGFTLKRIRQAAGLLKPGFSILCIDTNGFADWVIENPPWALPGAGQSTEQRA
ncbi:MAG: hypothetical protein ABR881_32075 [Candidatus Sulfotelmatobacter sp.]|jgi:hypothetical protein